MSRRRVAARCGAARVLGDLFSLARQYKSGKAEGESLDFINRFRFYSHFNAMLIHVQMSGATFRISRWVPERKRRSAADELGQCDEGVLVNRADGM
ncbi:MAG: hypothetical protein H0W76_10220 [Pyrinomonadaceae bacterium]|nr:hypothetical protein [Pyrinomonadaceae bacterium]